MNISRLSNFVLSPFIRNQISIFHVHFSANYPQFVELLRLDFLFAHLLINFEMLLRNTHSKRKGDREMKESRNSEWYRTQTNNKCLRTVPRLIALRRCYH